MRDEKVKLIEKAPGLTRVFELPSDNTIPLIQFEGKVAVTLDPFRVV